MRILNKILFVFLASILSIGTQAQSSSELSLNYEALTPIPDSLGVAGPYTGFLGPSQEYIMVAGGANFAQPVWENQKQYHDQIYLGTFNIQPSTAAKLNVKGETLKVSEAIDWEVSSLRLPAPMAYGGVATVPEGIILVGGHNEIEVFDAVWLLRMDENKQLSLIPLPSLPAPSSHAGTAIIGDYLYVTCGQSTHHLTSASNLILRLNISALAALPTHTQTQTEYPYSWEQLPSLPGPERSVHVTVSQHNGRNQALYVMSGRRINPDYPDDRPYEFLTDVWMYDPINPEAGWIQKTTSPTCIMAAPAVAYGQSHLFILGGADGSLLYQANDLKDEHPGFPKKAWAYHTITDTWAPLGSIPSNQVTTPALIKGSDIYLLSGEVRPRVRSNQVWKITYADAPTSFGWLNYLTLFVYLGAMLLVGFYFARKNKNTDDFFRGGQRIPWWAAACSIFATMLSSLTYMSVPAKAYMTNWEYIMGYPAILLTSILVIYLIMPFFRRIDATSAYEYLELRFNKTARYMGSSFFVLFQIGRMAIVMFLSALALAAITPFTAAQCILIMGVLSIIYSTLGGVEAVIWTDTIQTFVLLGGAILIFILVVLRLDGGFTEFIQVASADQKFQSINWDWDLMSYTTAAFWVIVIGGLGQNLVSYGSDQAVVQRYMTTADQKKSAKSILTNGIISLPAGLLFFAVGTALYVFYKSNPGNLNPGFQNDAIMPLFIVQEIPKGVAGLIIAGVFAAAQSTISTSMNSTATSVVTDFLRPWKTMKTEQGYLKLARYMTVFFGIAGTALALVFASADIKSLLDQFFAILGLFGGALGGMFLLGMFSRRANGTGAVFGALIGALLLFWISSNTQTHVYLYAAIGIAGTIIAGTIISLFFSKPNRIEGLTIFDLQKKKP